MREVFATAADWLTERRPCALATLVATRGGAPVPIGTTIAVDSNVQIAGSMGTGCNESEIVEAALLTLRDGVTRTLEIDLGGDDDPLSAGNGCGSILEIAVWRPQPPDLEMLRKIVAGKNDSALSIDYERAGERKHFEQSIPSKAPIVLIGGTSLAAEIAAFAARLDFRTIVVDPRPAYATRARLAHVDDIIVEWPDECLPQLLTECSPVIALSHDPKLDVPALRCALNSPAPYIGLLGSRKSQANRRERLRGEGFSNEALERIHGPVGLDIGGVTLAETALSIIAEIVATSHARSGNALSNLSCAIH